MLINNLKYKYLTFDELVINLDRLSRFKLPEISYKRVFYSILLKNLIFPKYSQKELDESDPEYISAAAAQIWNASVYNLTKSAENNTSAFNALKMLSDLTFKNTDKTTQIFISQKLNISPILERIDYNSAPLNLKFLIKVNDVFKNQKFTKNDLYELRKQFSLQFPISKLIIAEGITEEILLPVFAQKLHHKFDKEGIYVLGAGGKSKSPVLYMQMRDKLKIPVNILFDYDAIELTHSFEKQLLKKDKILIIDKGEFEDILSDNLIKRALNKEYLPATPIKISDLHIYTKMCDNIENFYRTRHLGEFKKSKVSKIIAKNIKYESDITDDIKKIITQIT